LAGLTQGEASLKWGAIHKVKDGSQTLFWIDTWLGDSPLKIQYPTLFSMCRDPNALVADLHSAGDWMIEFRRSLSGDEALELDHLMSLLHSFHLNNFECDKVEWVLDS